MRNFMQKIIKSIDNKDQVEALLNQYKSEGDFINEKDNHGDSLLHFASRIHCIPVMELLIQHGADPEAVNEHGRRPIHEVIDSIECVSYLVNTYVDVNAMKRGDWTPVMSAALKGNMDIVKLLVNAGALLNRTTKDGRTALYLAVQEGHIELSKYLTDQYPQAITQATKSGRFPTQAAAALLPTDDHDNNSKNTPAYITATYLISHATIPLSELLQHRDNSGRNILLDSSVSQNLALLAFLLDQGADSNDADSLGRNMIHHACMMGHLDVLKVLYQLKGTNWNTPDTWDKWTPLMHASRQGHLHVVKYLMEIVHVNKDCLDKQGRSAKDIACLWKHNHIVNYFDGVVD